MAEYVETELLPAVAEMTDLAREIALKYFRTQLAIVNKCDLSPVTIADREIEACLRDFIRQRFPSHGIIGEEHGNDNADAEFVWVIDPIDGTKAFATGKPLFGTIIGLMKEGRPLIGAIDQAYTKERWIASINGACFHNDVVARVSGVHELGLAKACTASPEMFSSDFAKNFDTLRSRVRWMTYSSDCYAYGLLALGHVDLVVERGLAIHDLIGLVPIINSAGGYVCDWAGNDIDANTDGSIIAAGSEQLARCVIKILSESSDV